MHNYERLEVWQVAYALARDIYADVAAFPAHEKYGMVAQMQKCAVSVPVNIAEGSRRLTAGEFRHFLGIASGSNGELDVFLRFSADFGYLSPEIVTIRRATNDRVERMIRGLIRTLGPGRPKKKKGRPPSSSGPEPTTPTKRHPPESPGP